MKPIRIDFAPPSIWRLFHRTHPVVWLLGMAGMILVLGCLLVAVDLVSQRQVLDQDILAAQARRARSAASRPVVVKPTITPAQADEVNNVVAQLNLPWRDLFSAIEMATPATIALLSIEPDAKKRLLHATAEAKNSDEMLAYIEQLKRQPFFANVILTRHEVNEQDPNKPLRFQFEAGWNGGAE